MNALLAELNRLGVAHLTTEDVFTFADNVFRNFSFLFQTEESGPRRIDLVSSLFEHLTVECVNDILDACSDEPPNGAGAGPAEEKRDGCGGSGCVGHL
ncbi:protein UL91 [Cercopithecine betaherpesvirus 5]|uniref:Protein UL91 n=1 Tax=Simian cytomegalovirus (strain Colburn) TaxID=50292 RepID=G8XTY7_SCMVC|nr:protein UL91 [Cercopithecine betaherpesvirus 5]